MEWPTIQLLAHIACRGIVVLPKATRDKTRLGHVVAALVAAGAILSTCGCATPPTDPEARAEFERTNDPLEPLNRGIFAFNLFADRNVIKPAAEIYETVIPEKGRDAIRNFLNNLGEPIVFANDLLQGEFSRAHTTAARFLMNTTFGLGGFMDLASGEGLEKQTGDFGQTLYSWGVPDGPYFVIPILGPSDVRDTVGLGVDIYADPWWHLGNAENLAGYGRYTVSGVDLRQRNLKTLDDLQKNALDYYAELRSLYRQRRAQELRHGEPAPTPTIDEGAHP